MLNIESLAGLLEEFFLRDLEVVAAVEGAVAEATEAVVYEGLVTRNGFGLLNGNLAGNNELFLDLEVDVAVVVTVLIVVL